MVKVLKLGSNKVTPIIFELLKMLVYEKFKYLLRKNLRFSNECLLNIISIEI